MKTLGSNQRPLRGDTYHLNGFLANKTDFHASLFHFSIIFAKQHL